MLPGISSKYHQNINATNCNIIFRGTKELWHITMHTEIFLSTSEETHPELKQEKKKKKKKKKKNSIFPTDYSKAVPLLYFFLNVVLYVVSVIMSLFVPSSLIPWCLRTAVLRVCGFSWVSVTKTYLYNFDPLKPHFYTVKLGFTGVYIIFPISALKHRLWVLVRTASSRRF